MTRVRVTTFARYAELLGTTTLEIDLPGPATVGTLIAALRSLPGGESLPTQPLVAVNHAFATCDAPLATEDDVALLPPLAGG